MRLLFLYNQEWTQEIADFYTGKVPAHRLFGFAGAEEMGHSPQTYFCPRLLRKVLAKPLLWRTYQALMAAKNQNRIDCIVATHEASALPVLLLKYLGLLRTPLVTINVALMHPKNLKGRKLALWKRLLPRSEVILSYCSAQLEWLQSTYCLEQSRLVFVPLGVDAEFFNVQGTVPEDFVLSVGTNEGKDFTTLVQALPTDIA